MSNKAYAVASSAVLVSFFLYLWQKQRLRESKLSLPPSMKGEWLIGHLRSLPPGSDHRYFAKLGEELDSDIVSFTILGQTT
ncbi:hypothetical protein FRC07_010006, partial [Ceratobasidium sp. 392]